MTRLAEPKREKGVRFEKKGEFYKLSLSERDDIFKTKEQFLHIF